MAAKILQSTQLVFMGSQDTMVNVITFTNWLEAASMDNQPLADFFRNRFSNEFKLAYEAWLSLKPLDNPAIPSSPLAMAEYLPARMQDAKSLHYKTDQLQIVTRTASANAAYYVCNTLFLVVALFLTGVLRIFSEITVRMAIQNLAFSMLVISIVNIFIGEMYENIGTNEFRTGKAEIAA